MRQVPLFENSLTGERLEVQIPLESRTVTADLVKQIRIPDYVDTNDFAMQKAIVILWASRNPSKFGLARKKPINLALFGGVGFKLHCPSCNADGPFKRTVVDVDLVTLKEEAKDLITMLSRLNDVCGSLFFHGITSMDRRFNAMQEGLRYRLITIKALGTDGNPVPGYADVFCDKLTFCHELNVRDDVAKASNQAFTIGIENLILTKAQYIRTLPKNERSQVDNSRVLGEYDGNNILVGMEPKDIMDVTAALLDHSVGEGHDQISLSRLGEKLKEGWALEKTVLLNLESMRRNLAALSSLGLSQTQIDDLKAKLDVILKEIKEKYQAKRSRFSFGKQWWTNVEEQVLKGVAAQ